MQHIHDNSSCYSSSNSTKDSEASSQRNKRGPLFRKPLLFWVRLILGAIFVIASVDKIYHPAAFARAIYNYQILPDELINIMAITLPWLEVILGLFLIIGVWLPGTVILTNALLVSFFTALVFNVARGLDVHCGCFSTSTRGDPATVWYLVRDSVFLLMGGYLFFKIVVSRRLDQMHRLSS